VGLEADPEAVPFQQSVITAEMNAGRKPPSPELAAIRRSSTAMSSRLSPTA
jgi:hypothetical protein